MRRALLVSPSARPGGAERALAALARHLPESGWQPTVVLLEDGPFTGWLEEAGVPATVVATGRTRRLDRTAVALRALRRLGQRVGAELVLSNQTKGHVYGGVTARLLGVPAAFWQHGVPESTALDRVAARVPAGAIVVSTAEALDAQRRLAPRARLRLIQPGVEIDDVARRRGEGAALRRRFGLRGPTVGIVGRLQPWKGQDVFLRAAAAVARVHPDVTFAVVGGAVLGWEGDYPATLQRFAGTTPELAGRVHFAGHQDDVYPWYDALDVVVHASRGEPFGLVLVEAMALGRPLVATADGGPLDIVEDGRSGLLVPPGDAEAMATAIARILGDPALAARLAAGGRERAEHFGAASMTRQWAELLDRLVAGPAPRGPSGVPAP